MSISSDCDVTILKFSIYCVYVIIWSSNSFRGACFTEVYRSLPRLVRLRGQHSLIVCCRLVFWRRNITEDVRVVQARSRREKTADWAILIGRGPCSGAVRAGINLWSIRAPDLPTGSTLRQDISVATMLRHLLLLLQIDLVVTRSGNLCSQ